MNKKNAAERQSGTNGTSPDDEGQFERFEQLTRRLLSVPKKEVDKQRAKKSGKKNR